MKKFLTPLILPVILLTLLMSPSGGFSQSQRPDEDAIRAFLESHPLITASDTRVLDVSIMGESLVIDLSISILPQGTYEEGIFSQLEADLDQALAIHSYYMTTFKVEGEPLEYWGRPMPNFDDRGDFPQIDALPSSGPLAGIKIALGPGHGLYWSETWNTWIYQRGEYFGIREDIVNAEIMRYVQAALQNQGATVLQLRQLDFDAGTGITGYPAWHESARRYAIAEGLPSWIYDSRDNNYDSDIVTRPYMANYYGADLLINLHNNGWDGTLRGTETYWDINHTPTQSQALANAVHNNIIQAIRQDYDPDWVDRKVKSTDWRYGEIYFAEMPAILIELAFMDNVIDNAALQDEAFKMLAAQAITRGICDYYNVTCEDLPITLPIVLERPTLTPTYDDGMCGSGWYTFTNQRGQPAYLTLNAQIEDQITHQAAWQVDLPIDGEYRLEAFIPDHGAINWLCPEKTISWDTSHAVYEITHANGTSYTPVDQAPIANAWVDLGTFYFSGEEAAAVTLTDVTGEPFQTKTVSASALRFTFTPPFYNTSWADVTWLSDEINAPVSSISNFLTLHNSCLASPIDDTDGVQIDIPSLVNQAAITYNINPKLLLAIMEAEQSALSQCPDSAALAGLMGLETPTTARAQIDLAGQMVANTVTSLAETGVTPNGWAKDTYKVTLDGVGVVAANDTIALLFEYTPYAGALWGGNIPDEKGVQAIYQAWIDYNLDNPLPTDIILYYFPLISR
jgi:N-acetylmuramoyl-L-alanine amidase